MKVLVTNNELCIGCHLCEDVCSQTWYKQMDSARSSIRITSLGNAEWGMAVCSQCGECIDICPTGALYRDEARGMVRLRAEQCDGCGACVAACPFGALAMRPATGTALVCDLCGGDPACVKRCATGAIAYAE